MKEDFRCHMSCDFFEKTEVQLFQSHLISLKTTSEREVKSTVSVHRGCSCLLMQLSTFDLFFFLNTSPNHFRKYFQLVNNHKSSTGKGQIVCLARCLLLFLIFLRSVGLPALSLINHQDVVGDLDGLQCQQRHTGETARFHSTGRRLT